MSGHRETMREFLKWALVLVGSLTVISLAMRALALGGVSVADSLVTRGVCCILLVVVFARVQKLSLRPKSIRPQLTRALVAGMALTLITLSYNWLTASAVSVLSNADVPLLVVLGPFVGIQASARTRLLAASSILFLAWYVSGLEVQSHLYLGLGALSAGSFLLCLGYLYIKKSMTEENEAVTILVPAIAIVVYGLAEKIFSHSAPVPWSPLIIIEMVLAGLSMFLAYYSTIRLYGVTDLASAEFPTLLYSIVIQPLEVWLLGTRLQWSYLASSAGFVIVTYFVVRAQSRTPRSLNLPLVPQTLDYTCGAACFESMMRHFNGHSPGEMHFAEQLGTMKLGYTPPENVVALAKSYALPTTMLENAEISDIRSSLNKRNVVFVTWWDEDAGHYSLVKEVTDHHITLMDPWTARDGVDNRLSLDFFVPRWRQRGARIIAVASATMP